MNSLSKGSELKDRILYTLLALIVFRLGSYIPVPGINSVVLQEIASANSEGVLGMFNMLSGGALGRMTIFALSITPYITASIIIQIMSVIYKPLEMLKKEGDAGRKKINQYTRYGTVILAMFQGYGIAVGLESLTTHAGNAVTDPGMFFRITAVTTLAGGTCFLMWVAEQITARGIGNGTSLIIFSGIVAGLPTALASIFDLGRTGAVSPFFVIGLLIISVALIYFIVFIERSNRRIPVQYPRRQVGNKIYEGDSSYIPIKINTAGVIPPIFASSILLFPVTIANFSSAGSEGGFLQNIILYLGHGKPLYLLLYVLLIVFFSFFYTAIIFNPEETAENLKKYGGFIPGKRPGSNTATYFDFVLTRLTVIGAAYLSLICVFPEVLISKYSVPFYLGGTSLLIVVNVVIDTVAQVQTHLFAKQYQGLLRKPNKGAR